MSARFSLRFALSSHPTSLSTFTRWATSIETVLHRNLIDPGRIVPRIFLSFLFLRYRDLINFLIRSNYQRCSLSANHYHLNFLYRNDPFFSNPVSGLLLSETRQVEKVFQKYISSPPCLRWFKKKSRAAFPSKLRTMNSVFNTSLIRNDSFSTFTTVILFVNTFVDLNIWS